MNRLQRTVILTVMVALPSRASAATIEGLRKDHRGLEAGWHAYQRGDIAAALTAYEHAAAADPEDATLWYDLGCLYALHGEVEKARMALQRALSLNPQRAEAFDALGQLHEQAGDLIAAHMLYASADILQPGRAKFLRHLIRTFLALEQPAPARQALQHLLRIESDDMEARYQLGVLELRANAPDLALTEFHEVLKRHPDHIMALNGAALAHARTGAFREAREAIDKAKALQPNSAITETNLGVIAAYQQRWEEARTAWERARKADPHFRPAAKNLELLTTLQTP